MVKNRLRGILLTVFREMSNSLAISRIPCPAPFNSYISFTSATFSNAPVHLRENYADDDTCFRWVNSNLLLLPSLELLVTAGITIPASATSQAEYRPEHRSKPSPPTETILLLVRYNSGAGGTAAASSNGRQSIC